MAYVERSREEIVAAYERFLGRTKHADDAAIVVGAKTYTFRQVVEGLKTGDPLLTRVFVDQVRAFGIDNDDDPVALIDSREDS